MRWIKGDGKDDHVTRSAIGLATRLLGETVDYRLDVNNIGPDRARRVLEWAAQPVELSFQEPADNLLLADSLRTAGCPPERYGYWWKWFPARARLSSPEMVLDGDMIIVKEPVWFHKWRAGGAEIYVTVDERCSAYGQFKDLVDGRGL